MIAKAPEVIELPEKLQCQLAAFMRREPTGSVVLHLKDGVVLAWELKETGRAT